ncbi:uncharacterized protein fbxw9 isoform X2 [Phyllopteryx taeniolatus]|uniref:uncharacterized protein fbxw9 isoform X2 n=1 Tax=Phyllopteryx taeniolatus TaxID=161469 RepID=UPI002AD57D2D|nr:uncharacterized protein fbxw9 isoform X2 [Phyllopteryx taeniolatus]
MTERTGHNMDPADSDPVRKALQAQDRRLSKLDEQLGALHLHLEGLSRHQDNMMRQVASQFELLMKRIQEKEPVCTTPNTATVPTFPCEAVTIQPPATSAAVCPQLSRPERFSGDSGNIKPFITQCELHFELQAAAFPTERAKIAFVISHLTGRAEAWATAEWSRNSAACHSWAFFVKTMEQIFEFSTPDREAARSLVTLQQGKRRVSDYAIEFCILAAESQWNNQALLDAFFQGLSPAVKDHLVPLDLPTDLDTLIALAVKIDKRLLDRELDGARRRAASPRTWRMSLGDQPNQGRSPVSGLNPLASVPTDEPMQLGRFRLSPEERQRRLREGRCFYCGQLGHSVSNCHVKVAGAGSKGTGEVCYALRNVGKDNTAWQLRARRLIGSKAIFPVGPREDFDWPIACLEMEELIACWTRVAQVVAKEHQANVVDPEGVGQQRRALEDGPAAEGQEDNRAAVIEPGRVEVQEEAYDVEEGVVFEEMGGVLHPVVGEDQLVELREVLEERLEDNPEEVLEEDGDRPVLFEGQDDAPDHLQDLAHLGFQGNRGHLEIQHQPNRSQSPPPALECLTLLSGHIAEINSVLLVGGGGDVCATGSRDRDVKLWNLQADSSNMLMHTLVGQGHFNTHQGWVWCLASQGHLLASGGFDRTVRLWDLQACGAERGVIRTEAAVICLSCLPDVLLAGTFNEKVQMYDPRAAVPLVKSLTHHTNSVLCLAADDKYIISASKDNTVVVHDRRADRRLYKVRVHIPCGPPKTLCTLRHQDGVSGLSVEAGVLAVASGDMCVKIWRLRKSET